MSLIFFISCSENEENFVEVNDLNVSSDKVFPEKVIDLSIENILIYPKLETNYRNLKTFSENSVPILGVRF